MSDEVYSVISSLIADHPGSTKDELAEYLAVVNLEMNLGVERPHPRITWFLKKMDEYDVVEIDGKFWKAIDVPMEPPKSVPDTSSLSGRRSGTVNAQRTNESKGRDGIDLTVTSSPLNYSNVTEIRVEYLNGTIVKEEVPTWTDLRICIGPEYPEGWHKVKTYRNVKFLYVFIGASEKATPIQPIGNDIYVGPK